MPNWLCTREQVKRAGGINGASQDRRIDRGIEGVSRAHDRMTHRIFIPKTQTRTYPWPSPQLSRTHILWLDADLISVTTLQTQAQDASPTTIPAADFFLEPNNHGPPFDRIEMDLSSTSAFEAGDTPQRSVSVAGSWGYSEDTIPGGAVASGLSADATVTTFVCSDGSLIDVGDTLLIQTEQVFVSARANAQVATQLINGALDANMAQVAVTVDDGTLFFADEVILVDSERMLIESITGNILTVIRAYDGSTLAAHTDDTAVHAFRTLTIERGNNGTTAATHADSTTITKYSPPLDIQSLTIAETLAIFHQDPAGWGRTIGTGDGAQEFNGRNLSDFRKSVIDYYRRPRTAAI